MDHAPSTRPRRLTDTTECRCTHCGQVMYREDLVAELQDDGTYTHRREVRGGYTQSTDPDGNPTGPVIPQCSCRD